MGQMLDNMNYLKEMNKLGCGSPDLWIAIETGFQAAVPALLSLAVPGCTDIVKMKLGLSPWHRRGIRSLIKATAAPFSMGANKFLYKIGYFHAEAGLYYLMVADVAVEFFTQWQSLVFVASQCQLPHAGTAYGYVAPFIYAPNTTGGLGIAPLRNVPGMAVGGDVIQIFPGFQGTVAFSAEWDSWPTRGQGVSVSTWCVEEDTGNVIAFNQTNQPRSQPYNQTAGSWSFDSTRAHTGARYTLHYENTGDKHAQAVSGSYTVEMRGNQTGVLPWGCQFKKTTIPFL